jgi:dihydroorotase
MLLSGVVIGGSRTLVDIVIANGLISSILPSAEPAPIDAAPVVLPGLVDLHTHLREPGGEGSETIETGTRAGAAGGYTDLFAMANLAPVTDTVERVQDVLRRSEGASARVHPIAAASIGLAGETLTDHAALAAQGVTVFSDDGKCLSDDDLVRETLRRMSELGTVFAQHAQDAAIVGNGVINQPVAAALDVAGWPAAGEESIIARDIAMAIETGGRLHVCHVSTRGTVELIRAGKLRGAPVTAEVTPHHLVLSDEDAAATGPRLKVNPPLRSRDDIEALCEGLRDGTIDAVGTDHAPHPIDTKNRPWAEASFGLTGLETALPIVAEVLSTDGRVDWTSLARVMSHAPAVIGGMEALIGRPIAVGEPATLCVIQQAIPWTVHEEERFSLSRNTPFDGRTLNHRVLTTMIDGVITHQHAWRPR